MHNTNIYTMCPNTILTILLSTPFKFDLRERIAEYHVEGKELVKCVIVVQLPLISTTMKVCEPQINYSQRIVGIKSWILM